MSTFRKLIIYNLDKEVVGVIKLRSNRCVQNTLTR